MGLFAALRTLVDRYHVTAVRVDAGGTLNGQLLAAGLVDEIDIVVAPHLAGTGGAGPVHLVDGVVGAGGRLIQVGFATDDHRLREALRGKTRSVSRSSPRGCTRT